MKYFLQKCFISVVALTFCLATETSAQEGRKTPEPSEGPDETYFVIRPGSPEALPPKPAGGLSDAMTNLIVLELAEAADFCGRIPGAEYTIDCLAYEYARIAAALPDAGEYSVVKKEISQAAKRFQGVVNRNRSATLPTARIAQGGQKPRRTARAIRPVATAALPKATAEAVQIIQETQTVLIRSTENSEERRRQFQKVVSAMDTGTILLRSI